MEVCIVYLSSSVEPFKDEDLLKILQQSRANNAEAGITGVLLYVRGSIIQVLEGDRDTVESLYRRIEEDPRHTRISQLLNRPINQRLFPNWAMGYETITDRQLQDFKDIVDLEDKEKQRVQADDNLILKTIKIFYESNRYN